MQPIHPNDYGKNITLEFCQKFDVNELVRQYRRNSKKALLEAQIEALGHHIACDSSDTNFGGKRLWFLCPLCSRRVAVLYLHPISKQLSCRMCTGLPYKCSRFKGMVENSLI